MGPISAISTAIVGTLKFSGRASRAEFWWMCSLLAVIGLVSVCVDAMMVIRTLETRGEAGLLALRPIGFATVWVGLLTLPTFLSLSARRLQDAGFSAFWLVLHLLPLGALVLLFLHALPGQERGIALAAPIGRRPEANRAKPMIPDARARAMQGYGLLFDKDKQPSAQQLAARKAEVSDYYRTRVLKSAPTA